MSDDTKFGILLGISLVVLFAGFVFICIADRNHSWIYLALADGSLLISGILGGWSTLYAGPVDYDFP